MSKYDVFKKSDMNKMLRDMQSSADRVVQNQFLNGEHDFVCPNCKSTIKVKVGENICPNCGQSINLKP